MVSDALHIFVNVLLPILLVAASGALLQRTKSLDVTPLVTLCMYLFMPVYLFRRISQSELSWQEVLEVGAVVLIPIALLGAATYYVLRARRVAGPTIAAMVCGSLFFNAANFGVPVSELAFGAEGGAIQALVMMFVNVSIFFVGYGIVALGEGKGFGAVTGFFRLPYIYAVAAAFLVRDTGVQLPGYLVTALDQVAAGMVPVALVTLGAQLAKTRSSTRTPIHVVLPVMLLKLVTLPALTAVVVVLFGLWPWPGAQLILASAGPAAVNTLLLSLEVGGDADTAADCVFWTTLGSAVTVSIVLSLLHLIGGNQLPTP